MLKNCDLLLIYSCYYLEILVEEEAEICKDHPQPLPAVAVLELAKQITAQLILSGTENTRHENLRTFVNSISLPL